MIYPLVIYHGKVKFPYSMNIFDYFASEDRILMKQFFFDGFPLTDLTQIPDQVLRKQKQLGLMSFTLKHIFAKDFTPFFREIVEWMSEFDDIKDGDLFTNLLKYLGERGAITDADITNTIIQSNLSANWRGKMMTLADHWRQQGMQQGMEQGISEGKTYERVIMVTNLLREGMTVDFVARVTGLSLLEIEELRKIRTIV